MCAVLTRALQKGDDHLAGALRDVTEMEQVAVTISANLDDQGRQIAGMKDRLSNINQSVDRAEGLMRTIYRNMMFNRIVVGIGGASASVVRCMERGISLTLSSDRARGCRHAAGHPLLRLKDCKRMYA